MKHRTPSGLITITPTLVLLLSGVFRVAHAADAPLEFNRDIRPILAEYCFACHGPDSASRKADLRLDKRDAAIEKHAIAPRDAVHSMLLERIDSLDATDDSKTSESRAEVAAAAMDRTRGAIPTPLVVCGPRSASNSSREECRLGPKPD